jgi:hypothetical protein
VEFHAHQAADGSGQTAALNSKPEYRIAVSDAEKRANRHLIFLPALVILTCLFFYYIFKYIEPERDAFESADGKK